jgi:hypothetical protein
MTGQEQFLHDLMQRESLKSTSKIPSNINHRRFGMNTRIRAFPQKFFESAPSALASGKNIANDIYDN